ncbi:hypothetical protein EVA_11213 [gut metagenome]|uniref:Uncharacterized protein n=1 Tax=gut metagenome TaxID=749906 RepID=J9CKT8_9ZZZZ
MTFVVFRILCVRVTVGQAQRLQLRNGDVEVCKGHLVKILPLVAPEAVVERIHRVFRLVIISVAHEVVHVLPVLMVAKLMAQGEA